MGEFLPFALNRLEQRMSRIPDIELQRPPTQVLRENFYVTTSGNNHMASLLGVLLEVGADRVLFAADYPFEEMADGATGSTPSRSRRTTGSRSAGRTRSVSSGSDAGRDPRRRLAAAGL